MSTEVNELDQKIDQLIARGREIGTELEGKADATRVQEISDEQAKIRDELVKVNEEREAAAAKAQQDELVKFMEQLKADAEKRPSKAAQIGTLSGDRHEDAVNFFATVAKARRGSTEAKASLDAMGASWSDVPGESAGSLKATLGTTDGTGGYLIPNAVVSTLIDMGRINNPMRNLLTVVNGIRGTQVEVPTEGLAPTRASITTWGSTKDNVDLTVNSYTATLYTLAVIADASNQLLRHSEGAAEQMIRSNIAERIALGEQYYVLNGSGTNQPKGILTSVGTSGDFVSSFSPAATLAGSISKAIATAAGAVSTRNRIPDAALLHPSAFWALAAEGTDEAGFFLAPTGGPTDINPRSIVSPFGIPVYQSTEMPTDDLLVGQFKRAQFFVGDDFRVDTSTEAGDRWDKNLTGFRAEEEIGFNADPYVVAGYFQRITDVIP